MGTDAHRKKRKHSPDDCHHGGKAGEGSRWEDVSLVLGVGVGERDPDVADSVAYLTGQWFLF